ncbi:ABC transporter permease [Metamycoplasma neophronis]|uniref:ABC transporter permease n=1 Tax=Metamycoplasma neophronis TaxID=872983 RepID=A0ABY2Z1I4_9BACT|nr:ABC transporter permease [Metamycoplasma neophronis]TPR54679.1 ABC transporter permease [Metamycoplasma neophronis]
MRRLFKEVFKSLSKNKVTLICLTILIFLTTFLFTLLNDVQTSYSTTINAYDKVSRLHDLTVDLDVNPSGVAPNSGFSQIGSDNVSLVKEPVKFESSKNGTDISYSINLAGDEQNYIKLKNTFGNWDIDNDSYYISTEDFMRFYYEGSHGISSVDFEIAKPNPDVNKIRNFTFSGKNREFKLYVKQGSDFIPLTKLVSINKNQTITFNKEISISDIASISFAPRGFNGAQTEVDYLYNPSPLFINIKTLEASFSTLDFDKWNAENNLVIIQGPEVLKLMGFKTKENNPNQYVLDTNAINSSDIKIAPGYQSNDKTITPTDKFQLSFNLNSYLENHKLEKEINQYQILEANKTYLIPENWVRSTQTLTTYNWYRYILNWNEKTEEENSNWKGSYLKFIEQFKLNDPENYKKISYFSYWNKTLSTTYKIGKTAKQTVNQTLPIEKDDALVIFKNPWTGGNPSNKVPEAASNLDRRSLNNIKQVEFNSFGDAPITDDEFKNISNLNQLKEHQNFIRSRSEEFAKTSIINDIRSEVGEENLGIRQSLTVETVNEDTAKKNVFHFVNMGDKEHKLLGITQNVDKLYNDTLNPSILNGSISNTNVEKFILKPKPNSNIIEKIPAIYSLPIISAIFKQYTPDMNYFNPDIRFTEYYDFFPKTQVPYSTNGKILVITTGVNEPANIKGSTVIGAIAMPKPDKYIVLKYSPIPNYTTKKVWNKVVVDGKDYLSLNELYKFMVQQDYTVRGEIGPNGWAAINPVFQNSISLPISFGAISNELTSEIVQKKTIKGLMERARTIILDSDLSKLFKRDDIYRVFNAIGKSVEANDFHTLLAVGKTNKFILEKVILDVIKYLNEPINHSKNQNLEFANMNANTFIKNLLGGAIDYLQVQYEKSGSTQQERDEYLVKQITNLSSLINLNGIYVIPQLRLSIYDLIELIKDKSVVFSSLKQIINSIDFVKFSAIIQDWYDKHPYKPFTSQKDTYWTLSEARLIISLLKSVDEYQVKKALQNLIAQVDLQSFLDPESPSSYYQRWIMAYDLAGQSLSNENKEKVKQLFTKLNGAKENEAPYSNINNGLFELISNINLSRFTQSLDKLIQHVKYPVTANNKIYNDYNTESLTSSDYLTAFLTSVNSSYDDEVNVGKIAQIQDAIIKIFNLSGKTDKVVKELNIAIPASDDKKISMLDLQTLMLLGFPTSVANVEAPNATNLPVDQYNLDDINKIIIKINKSLESGSALKLTENEFKFLKNSVLATNFDISDLQKLKDITIKYRDLISKLFIKNYMPENGVYDFSNQNLLNKEVATYGDLAYRSALINPNDPLHENDKEILQTLHSVLAKNFVGGMLGQGQKGIIQNQLIMYSLWIKLAYQLNSLAIAHEKTFTDPNTGDKYIDYNYEKFLSYDQIRAILLELFKAANTPEIKNMMANYDAVINPIPSMGILGSDDNYRATLLKVAYANARTTDANSELIKAINESKTFKALFENLKKLNIPDNVISQIKDVFLKNSNEISYNFGYIASADQMPTFYLQSLEAFISSFMLTEQTSQLQPLITSDYEFRIIYKQALEAANLPELLSLINVPRNLLNPFTFMSFPQILLYYLLSPNPNEGNLSYVVKKIFSNLQGANIGELKNKIIAITQSFNSSVKLIESRNDSAINLDVAYFNYLYNQKLKAPDGTDLVLFNMNITKTIKEALTSIIQPIVIYNMISYTDAGSYLAKVNYGYLNSNSKEVYKGDISKYLSNPYEMQLFISSLDDKYKVKVNTQEYLIIGVDSTSDYLYPVVNEENIQVDTNSQAILFVNSKGFDRIYSAYPTFAIKTYVLVKAPTNEKGKFLPDKSPEELKAKFNVIVNEMAPGSTRKVYLKDEQDSINPERYIRIITVRSIVSSIKNATIYLISILTVLVSFIVYFIIKRYIEARNKVVGILRAQGYKTSEIALAFCAFGWIPAAVGGIMGYILGFALQKPTMRVLSSYWTLENNIIPFNALAMLATIFVPLIFVSILIYIITQLSVRRKPTELMSGLTEVSVGNVGQKVSALFRRLPVKMRFIASMALNNFWKMFSLFLAFSTTSLISMFFLSSNNVFNKAISKTYSDRLYSFKLDLESPSTEGGPFVTYNKNNINELLYVPNDLAGNSSSNGSQLDYDNPNFLRPGGSFNTDIVNHPYNPTVITKSSLDILMDLSVELSPWDITYANMPETQRARVAQIFRRVSLQMQNTQYLIDREKLKEHKDFRNITSTSFNNYMDIFAVRDIKKFLADYEANKPEDMSNRTSYFLFTKPNYNEEQVGDGKITEQFRFVEWDPVNEVYLRPKKVTTSSYRQEYRNFLVNAYRQINGIDFFVSFGGVYWNDTTNEKYTYAKTLINGKENKIYGYYDNSRFIRLQNRKGVDLTKKLREYNYEFDSDQAIPVVINQVASRKYKLDVGSEFDGTLLNHVDRFSYQALMQQAPKTNYKFVVIGISETFINVEISTRKDILDHILGYDTLSMRLKKAREWELNNALYLNPDKAEFYRKEFDRKYDAFNGILSNDVTPVQTIDTLTTYSSTGFWGAASSYDVAAANDQSVWTFFKRIFISNPDLNYVSVYEHNVKAYNEAHPEANLEYKTQLFKLLNINEDQFNEIVKLNDTNEKYKTLARNVLTKFYGTQPGSIYGKNIMYGASFDVNSKDIEAGFISGISGTINTILVAFIIISLVISIVILIVITNIMIASNQRAIATFSVLGYTNNEKIFLFFFNFVPAIILACILMIPVTLSFIALFNAFMMVTSQIVLPLVLHISTIILSTVICLSVFIATSVATWKSLNKVKAVDALKGK